MASSRYVFERFALDPVERQLWLDTAPVELNGRYLDALALMVKEQGKLISKDRFLEEVWRGIPVTDEALTQCIRTIRKQLGDSAASPRFIETVPKHGYRFIAPVEWVDGSAHETLAEAAPDPLPAVAPESRNEPAYTTITEPAAASPWQQFFIVGGSGTAGGAIAGIIGGLFFGLAGVSQPSPSGMGTISVLLVFLCLSILLGLIGGAGVSFGIAAANFAPGRAWQWSMFGGAAGGMIVGAVVKMLGLDAFNLLFGQSPGDITGAIEGALLGAAVGGGVWAGSHGSDANWLKRSLFASTLGGATVGALIPSFGGRLMGGSLDLLARSFPNSRFRLDQIGAVFGETEFGPVSQAVTGALEGAVFSAFVAGTMLVLWHKFGARNSRAQ